MKRLVLLLCLQGCTLLAEQQHQSHLTQHFGPDKTNFGYDVTSLGIRLRPRLPYCKVTIDLLEGYSWQDFQGRREVFTGRVSVEF